MSVSRARKLIALLFTASLAAAAVGTTASADAGGTPNLGQSPYHRNVCVDTGQAGVAHCHAQVVTDAQGKPLATSGPSGYGPADLKQAYALANATGTGTVAIVDAYNDPTAEADLVTYRSTMGISPACTTSNGCFRKVDQNGGTSYPATDAGWAQEISLDLDTVSAVCPACHILLVETNSSYMNDLGAGVNTAARLGAKAISNSYGGNEFSSEASYDSYYSHPGIAVTVSSGDNGYGTEYPAASPYVTAVGGTTLTRSSTASRGFTETAWSGAGSGCSAYEALKNTPLTQPNVGCGTSTNPRRMVADVSAVANPNTGVAVYDSTPYAGASGWMVFGGTSVASPLIAAVYVLSGNTSGSANTLPYASTGSLNDVTSGSNGRCRRVPTLYCNAVSGYDGPTGLGTPNGTGAF